MRARGALPAIREYGRVAKLGSARREIALPFLAAGLVHQNRRAGRRLRLPTEGSVGGAPAGSARALSTRSRVARSRLRAVPIQNCLRRKPRGSTAGHQRQVGRCATPHTHRTERRCFWLVGRPRPPHPVRYARPDRLVGRRFGDGSEGATGPAMRGRKRMRLAVPGPEPGGHSPVVLNGRMRKSRQGPPSLSP